MVSLQVKTEIHTVHSAKSILAAKSNATGRVVASGGSADDWINGDRQTVWEQIQRFMGTSEFVRQCDGRLVEKKRRRDAKCLVVGTLYCQGANPKKNHRCSHARRNCMKCCESTAIRLKQVVGADTAMSLSMGGEFPRLRFYAAGNPKSILSVLSGLTLK